MEFPKEIPLRVVTVCSGYESQCLSLDRLKEAYPEFDHELVAWAEFDPTSKRSLEKQPAVVAHNALFPQWADRNLGDMTKIDWTKVDDFDFLFYSTPCQDVSAAGLGRGFEEGSGTRSSIIWHVRDAVKEKRPKYLCLENVKKMVQKKFLPTFNLWKEELEKLGYVNFCQVLDAADYGVPQHRERIFMVSVRDDSRRDGIATYPTFHFPEPMVLKKRLKDVCEEKVEERLYLSEEKIVEYMRGYEKS